MTPKLKNQLVDCSDCAVKPGQPHESGCDMERCSVCGGQWIGCGCEGNDKAFSRWLGYYPGDAEAEYLGIDLNTLHGSNLREIFFKKPL